MGSVVIAYGPSCPTAHGIFLDQGLNMCPLHWQVGFKTTGSAGKPHIVVIFIAMYDNTVNYPYMWVLYSQSSEKALAPYSSTLAWEIPWTEEPGGLQSMGSRTVGHD